jgi:hypothetical protein
LTEASIPGAGIELGRAFVALALLPGLGYTGLEAIAHGFFRQDIPAVRALSLQLPVFDTLYLYRRNNIEKGE